jgi:isoleucyl-tRNA synthetase
MAPLAPFTADWLFRLLEPAAPSVHLSRFPAPDDARSDAALEERMALARAVTTATLALRNETGINVRQPLPALLVVTGTGGVDEAVLRSVESIILDEVNVKRLDVASADSGAVRKTARANFKALGRRLGPLMKEAAPAAAALGADRIAAYEATGTLALDLPSGARVDLVAGDLEITSVGVEGQLVRQETAAGRTVTVALNTRLDDALRAEGLAREFVNRVQALRKEAGFDVADRIRLTFAAPDAIAQALAAHDGAIRSETLAVAMTRTDTATGESVTTARLGDAELTIGVERIATS